MLTLLPFEKTLLEPRTERHFVSATAQVLCLPVGYVGTAHPCLRIEGARIGRRFVWASAGAVPALAMVIATWAGAYGWPLMEPEVNAGMTVGNVGDEPIEFLGALLVLPTSHLRQRDFTESEWNAVVSNATERLRRLSWGDRDAINEVRQTGWLGSGSGWLPFYAELIATDESGKRWKLPVASEYEYDRAWDRPRHLTYIEGDQRAVLIAENRHPFRLHPRHLIIPSMYAQRTLVHDFRKGGGEPELLTTVPAEVFSENSFATDVRFPFLAPGERMVLEIEKEAW